MAVERTPLEWVVGDILPAKGRCLLTASAKSGKTFFALELGLSVAAGADFLGLRVPRPQRVLYCQSELSDALLNRRLGWIRETMPFGFPWELAGENFHVVENDPVRVTLADDAGRARIEGLIETWKPALLILDPLYDLFRGLEKTTLRRWPLR
jgi:RecA-family ATPase